MALETKTTLSDKVIAELQNLIQINIDSSRGFNEAAEQIEDPAIADLFRTLGTERSAFAAELQTYVAFNYEEPQDDGSVAAALHRAWIDIRSMISGGDNYAILAEAERGEDQIKEAYEKTLKETAGSAMNDVLQQQYAQVKAGHDQVRDLRNAYKARN